MSSSTISELYTNSTWEVATVTSFPPLVHSKQLFAMAEARAELLAALVARGISRIQAAMAGYADAVQGVQLQAAAFELLARVTHIKEVELDTLIAEMRVLATRRRATAMAATAEGVGEADATASVVAAQRAAPSPNRPSPSQAPTPVAAAPVTPAPAAEPMPAAEPTSTAATESRAAPAAPEAAAALPLARPPRLPPARRDPLAATPLSCMSPGSRWLLAQENQAQENRGAQRRPSAFGRGQPRVNSSTTPCIGVPRAPLSPVGSGDRP